jgi:hypothetical protein
MTAKKDNLGHRAQRASTIDVVAAVMLNILILTPSVFLAAYLRINSVPLQYAYFVTCTVLMLAVFNFATVVFISQSGKKFAQVTIPALLSVICIILMFVIMESLNRFYSNLGYGLLTPFVAFVMMLIYVSVFVEKNMVLKAYLGINVAAPMLLWAMSMSGKIVMPF